MPKSQPNSKTIQQAAAAALPQHLDQHLEVWYEDIAIWITCAACGATWYTHQYIDPHTYQYHYRFTPTAAPLTACCESKPQ